MRQVKRFYITHVVPGEVPENGLLRKLLFFTATDDSLLIGEYYWGLGHNTYTSKQMDEMILNGSVEKLKENYKVNYGKGVWMNADGELFLADIKDPFSDKEIRKIS